MKTQLLFPIILVSLAATGFGGDEPSKTTALYYELHTREFADAKISLDVASVRPIAPDAGFAELKFFRVMTWDKKNDRFGGGLVCVIPSADSGKFVDRYGVYVEGAKPRKYGPDTHKLTGTLRVSKHAHMYLDVSGAAKDVLKERELPPHLWETGPGQGGPGRRLGGGK